MRSCAITIVLVALQLNQLGCGQTREIDPAVPQSGPLIGTWQYVSDDLVDNEADLRAQHDRLLEKINEMLARFDYEPVDSAEVARLKIENLSARWQGSKKAEEAISTSRNRIENTVQPELDQVIRLRAEILNRLELDEAREHIVDDWLRLRTVYEDLESKLSQAAQSGRREPR